MSLTEYLIAFGVIFAGTVVQSSLGFGFGLLAAPVLAIIDERLVPPTALVLATTISAVVAFRERASLDFRGLRWAFVGRVAGTAIAGVAVTRLDEDVVVVVLALTVLFAVAVSIAGWHVRRTRATLTIAGLVSGTMGTLTSIGGPPMALLYQREEARRLRASLASFFLVGALISVAALARAGELDGRSLTDAAKLSPGLLLGLVTAAVVGDRLRSDWTRRGVLALSSVSSIVLLVRALS